MFDRIEDKAYEYFREELDSEGDYLDEDEYRDAVELELAWRE